MEQKVIERVRLLTGKDVEFKRQNFGGTIFSVDNNSFTLLLSNWVEYKQAMEYYDIDIISDFSHRIIKALKLKTL